MFGEKRKHVKTTHEGTKCYRVVRVHERGPGCFYYQGWHQTEDGFKYTPCKGGRKNYGSADEAFKAGGIGKTTPFYEEVNK